MKRIWIMTIFPEYFEAFLEHGIAAQAFSGSRGIDFEVKTLNIREYGFDKHGSVDDYPYGGGPGMIMRADVLKRSLYEGVIEAGGYGEDFREKLHIVYTGPRGKVWSNYLCREFAGKHLTTQGKDLVFLCGRYEGVDERFLQNYVDETISLGDYVLTGGELAVLAILDSAIRFAPEVLGNKAGANEDSFEDSLLEHPQFTRPREFEGENVPAILLSGHHQKIAEYQKEQQKIETQKHRPDLWERYQELENE